jgi:hypothetical protein
MQQEFIIRQKGGKTMEKSHKFLTKGELAKRWGKDYKTINK